MSNVRFSSFLILLYGISMAAFANAAERTPAGFGSGEKTLASLIKFPEFKADMDKLLACQGIIKTSGKLAESACFIIEPRDAPFVAAINKATKKARFIPASYDGKNIGIYFQYLVRFTRKDEDQLVTLYANQGYQENLDAYGADHIAAQRSVTREKWQNACPNRAKFIVLARAHVAYDGTQSSISVTHGSGIAISGSCERAIVETIEQSVFIPAYADGEPVPSSYLEAFGN